MNCLIAILKVNSIPLFYFLNAVCHRISMDKQGIRRLLQAFPTVEICEKCFQIVCLKIGRASGRERVFGLV